MGAQGTNQHLKVLVSGSTEPVAVANLDALGNGETTFLIASGAGQAAVPSVAYRVAHKNSAGAVYLGNEINPATSKSTSRAYSARVEQVQTITIAAAPTVGDQYVVKLNVPNYGGLLSQQDDVNFYGNHTVKAGDDASAVAAGLRASLAKAVGKATVAFAAVSGTTTAVVVTGLGQPYEQAKWSGRLVNFNLELSAPDSVLAGAVDTAIGSPGFGEGNRVAEQEEFYAGYNTGYKNRFADWPTMTNPTLDAKPTGKYDGITITHAAAQNTGSAVETIQRQTVILYFDTEGTDPTP